MKFNGLVLFLKKDGISADLILDPKYHGETAENAKSHLLENAGIPGLDAEIIADSKVFIAKDDFGINCTSSKAAEAMAANGTACVVASEIDKDFRDSLESNYILPLDLDKKSIADMFRTFENKDTECKIEQKEDGSWKLKLIAGSLSKSYIIRVEGASKEMIESGKWIGLR